MGTYPRAAGPRRWPEGKLSSQSAITKLSWGFHTLRGGIDPRALRFRPRVVGVKALVRWATGKRLTNRLPILSLIALSPPLNRGILGLRMGLYVPTPKFFYNLWGPRESDSSES